jgi:hypothetical protein
LKAKQFDESMMFALKQDVGFHFISNSNPAEVVNLQIDILAVKGMLQWRSDLPTIWLGLHTLSRSVDLPGFAEQCRTGLAYHHLAFASCCRTD